MKNLLGPAVFAAAVAMTIAPAFGHVTVQPRQSAAGAIEKYALRVPTEKFVLTVRVEVEFPTTLDVSSFEPKAGWKIEEKKDTAGKLVGVVLIGSIPPGESSVFNFAARNPSEEGKVFFKAVQIYEDGTRSEWTGPEGSRTPAPVVEVKKSVTNNSK